MKFMYTGADANMNLTDRRSSADSNSKTQVDRIFFNTATKRIYAICRCSAEDIYRSRQKSFFWIREVGICRCDVADVKTQVEINFLQTPTTLILTFLFERQGSVDWCPRNATRSHEMSIVIHWGQIAMWVCSRPTLFTLNASRPSKAVVKLWFCICLLNSLRHTRVRHRKEFSSMSVWKCP